MFQLRLRSFGDHESVIGGRFAINITVLGNDDANGVFVFAPNNLDLSMSE